MNPNCLFNGRSLNVTLAILALGLVSDIARAANLDKMKSNRARLIKEMMRLNDNLSCAANEDCKVIAIGARACGGPEQYLLTSVKNEKQPAIERKATEITKLDSEINHLEQMMGTCEMRMPPEVSCNGKTCVNGKSANPTTSSPVPVPTANPAVASPEAK